MSRVAVLKGGRSLERQVSLTLRSARRGRARAARPRGRRDRCRRATSSSGCATRRPRSPSSRCTARAARTAPFRSCSRCSSIPYTGSGVSACARCSDKVLAKHALRDAGLPTPDWVAFSETAFRELGAGDALGAIGAPARLPARRQAGRAGLGARHQVRPHRRPTCRPRSSPRFSYDHKVLLERYVEGRELAVSVLGRPTAAPQALPIVEAIPRNGDVLRLRGALRDRPHDFVCPADLDDAAGARLRSSRSRPTSCSAAPASRAST